MSRLTDLIAQVKARDPQMGLDLEAEFKALSKRRAFGLNFERHKPEEVELPGRPVRRGDKVRVLPERGTSGPGDQRLWVVTRTERVDGKRVAHLRLPVEDNPEEQVALVEDLVVVAAFGDAIYPGLVETGRVERGEEDDPFHTVINAENYHALRTLTYTHRGKIDCIYIDPPYNSGAKDWKYNNNYVEGDDLYRHSKWLAFIERRLKIARELLNPEDSVLIVTIDEREYLRLGLLLEQTFPEARRKMISSVINPKGVGVTEGFKRVDEYIFILRFGQQGVSPSNEALLGSYPLDAEPPKQDSEDDEPVRVALDWQTARRRDLASVRPTRPAQFYPIYVNEETGLIEEIGEAIPHEMARSEAPTRPGCATVFPVRDDGTEMNWGVTAPTFRDRWQKGYARAGKAQSDKPQPYIIQYLKSGPISDIEAGRAVVEGRNPDGSVIAYYEDISAKAPPTQWNLRTHNAEHYGTKIIKALLPGRSFPFPKSLYAVEDVLRLFVKDKPEATILDFFSGSGTTAHAVMRLNKQDGGKRQCISVTNNEVGAAEQAALRSQGFRPGDAGWEAQGICDSITKPRLASAITGLNPEGEPITVLNRGKKVRAFYRSVDPSPMDEGFKANARFFTLTYETPISVSHNRAYARIAPLLWLRAGAQGREISTLPEAGWEIADTYALLHDLDTEGAFLEALEQAQGLRIAYIVTDDAGRFESVSSRLPEDIEPVRLYESYLTNLAFLSGD